LVDQTTFGAKPVPPAPDQLSLAMATGARVPLVVIHSALNTQADVETLQNAIALAQARRPDANYDIVTVVPASNLPDNQIVQAQQAEGEASDVMTKLIDLGVSPARIHLAVRSAPDVSARELRIYIR
jgi:hypothetical protein